MGPCLPASWDHAEVKLNGPRDSLKISIFGHFEQQNVSSVMTVGGRPQSLAPVPFPGAGQSTHVSITISKIESKAARVGGKVK